jgi:hypothetical protein
MTAATTSPPSRRERRWLVIAEDGRHSTLGRHSDPSPDEIENIRAIADAQGWAGWLVISEGVYYSSDSVDLMVVRRITSKDGDWDEAARRWHGLRREALDRAG